MMKPVCYQCPDRWVANGRRCHDTCEKCIKAKAEHDRERVEKQDAYLKEKDINELKFKAVARVRKITARAKHVSGLGVK